MRTLITSFGGVAFAMFLARKSARERIFHDYCAWLDKGVEKPVPSNLLERIEHVYGEALSNKLKPNVLWDRSCLCGVLYKKATFRYWFSDPRDLLDIALEEASLNN